MTRRVFRKVLGWPLVAIVRSRAATAAIRSAPAPLAQMLAKIGMRVGKVRSVGADVEPREVVTATQRDDAAWVLITQGSFDEVTTAVDAIWHDSLSELAVRIVVRDFSSSPDLSAALRSLIVLRNAEIGRARLQASLRVAERIPSSVRTSDALDIVRTCLRLGGQRIDPYEPPGIPAQARFTAAALIAEHPRIESQVLSEYPHSWLNALVVAAALQLRPDPTPGFEAVLETWDLTANEALEMARASDTMADTTDPLPRSRESTLRFRARALVARLASAATYAAGPLSVWALAQCDFESACGTRGLLTGGQSLLTAFGILVTVHVIAAELSASRLPGPIARATAFSPSIRFTYSFGLSLIVYNYAEREGQAQIVSPDAVPFALIALVTAITVAMWSLLRRVDVSRASRHFLHHQHSGLARSGSAIGRIQMKAIRFRRWQASVPYTLGVLSSPVWTRNVPIRAVRRGFVIPRLWIFPAMSRLRKWQSGGLTLLVTGVGTSVGKHEEIGWLVPDAGTSLRTLDTRLARLAIGTRLPRGAHSGSRSLKSLVSLAGSIASDGDRLALGTALEHLEDALGLYMGGVRAGRRERHEDDARNSEPWPVAPGLQQTIATMIDVANRSADDYIREDIDPWLIRLVRSRSARDAAVTISVPSLQGRDTQGPGLDFVLANLGTAALSIADDGGLELITRELKSRIDAAATDSTAIQFTVQAASQLTATSALVSHARAEKLWGWYEEAILPSTLGHLGAMRVGGAALVARNLSLATSVALALRDQGIDGAAMEELLRQPLMSGREQVFSDMGGGYLGKDAEASLVRFARFLTSMNENLNPLTA